MYKRLYDTLRNVDLSFPFIKMGIGITVFNILMLVIVVLNPV